MNTACENTLSSTSGITRGHWNHISVVVNATHHTNDVRFYINGSAAGHRTSNVLGAINNGTNATFNDLIIGGKVKTSCRECFAYKGFMDEITIINEEWTAADVALWRNSHHKEFMPGYNKGILSFTFDRAHGPIVTNRFNTPGQTGSKFDAILNTTDATM